MVDIPAAAVIALGALVAIIMYVLLWRATSNRSVAAKLLARAVFPLVIIVPALLSAALVFNAGKNAASAPPPIIRAPTTGTGEPADDSFGSMGEEQAKEGEERRRYQMQREEEAGASEKPGAPAPLDDDLTRGVAPSMSTDETAPDGAMDAEPRSAGKKAKANGESGGAAGMGAPVPLDDLAPGAGEPPAAAMEQPAPEPQPTPAPAPVGAAPPPAASAPAPVGAAPPPPAASMPSDQPATRGLDLDAKSGGGGGTGIGSATAPSAPAPPPSEDWDIVPVFYGTDRSTVENATRLDYGSGRGRRLELGRALVTVPKLHKVPAIERPWAIRIPYLNVTLYEEAEDPKTHFTMKEINKLSQDEFLALVRERLAASKTYKDHALIFIHGYNTSFDYAVYRTAQIAYDLKFDGAPFAYSWPSGGGLASYTYDRESSGQAEPYLKQFIELVIKQTGAKSVSVIAHSMGNQPTLQVLKDLKASKPVGVIISQIILAAPDVDRDNFENISESIQGLANGVTLYAASNDRALMVSRNFYGGIPRAGDVPPAGPLVLPGVDTIDVTAASMDSLGLNHSGYAENNALLADIGLLIQSGTRPPGTRTPTLEQITTAKGPYWRYRPR
jgi:esterase/lipase superfamily enzyme